MARRRFGTERRSWPAVYLRGWALGGLGGAVTGALVGTCIVPLFGTIYGLIYGLVYGLLIGLPCALTLMVVTPLLPNASSAVIAGAFTGVSWCTVAVITFELTQLPVLTAAGLVLSALVGAWVAPRATFRREERTTLLDAPLDLPPARHAIT